MVFASTYFVMERVSAANFTQPLTRTGALYFTVTVFSTVGFGDITPNEYSWGPCNAAGNEDRIQAAALARPLPDSLPANSRTASSCAADIGPSATEKGERGELRRG